MSYDMKLSQSGWIQHMTGYVTSWYDNQIDYNFC